MNLRRTLLIISHRLIPGLILSFLVIAAQINGQGSALCTHITNGPKSARLANYDIRAVLDPQSKVVTGREVITWENQSPDTLSAVRMYMYMNAFKNTKSSFMSGMHTSFFGGDLSRRPPREWGWIDIQSIEQEGRKLQSAYVTPDDDNPEDQTVLEVMLSHPLAPGEILRLHIEFETKMPKTLVRSGYSRNNFFLVVHWYPKMGVYEADDEGRWGWNCHQFLRQMEFYADFGVYDIEITTSSDLVLGASGCHVESIEHEDGTSTHIYHAEDVIDFAWCAYPDFCVYRDQWRHVEIELLYPPHHAALRERIIQAVKISLEYLNREVGEYPYSKITVMDPPAHALRSGFMEYPTFITGGSFVGFPKELRSMESLIVHEFTHQYFMAMLANNEKEDAWMDEGFVNFYEDCIMESRYGEGESLIDILGYSIGNWELTRNEYTQMPNKRVSAISTPSYLIKERYKGIIYSKTALTLRTLKGLIGEDVFREIMREYFTRFRFTHPRKDDFLGVVREITTRNYQAEFTQKIMHFLEQALDGTAVCDYAVQEITTYRKHSGTGFFNGQYRQGSPTDTYYSSARIHRLHDMAVPVEVEFTFSDGHKEYRNWDGRGHSKLYEFDCDTPLTAVEIDPERKIYLDIDFNNNSFTLDPNPTGIIKYSLRAVFWLQNIFQSISFLM